VNVEELIEQRLGLKTEASPEPSKDSAESSGGAQSLVALPDLEPDDAEAPKAKRKKAAPKRPSPKKRERVSDGKATEGRRQASTYISEEIHVKWSCPRKIGHVHTFSVGVKAAKLPR
jgi:hypothetical protein